MEWIEFQLLMGADKIRIYVYSIPEKTQKVLEYYEKNEKVEIVKLGLPGKYFDFDFNSNFKF